MIKAMFVFLVILLASIITVVVLYLAAAVWSERQAEKKANADCALAVPGRPLAQLQQQLAQTQGVISTQILDGQGYLSSTHKSKIVLSRYVCMIDIGSHLVTRSEVIYKD
jgi:hypothetical protein